MSGVGLRVPYITAWSGEALSLALGFASHPESTGLRLTYLDPVPTDWIYGVLRARQGLTHGGRPEWKLVHALRQWRCMERRLCQVCGRSAVDGETGRTWWLLADDEDEAGPQVGYANAPPTCRKCMPEAVRSCPRLRQGAMAFTVSDCEPYAVLGHIFRPLARGVELVEQNVMVLLEEFQRLECMLAHQLVVLLHDLQPIELHVLQDLAGCRESSPAPGQWWSRAVRGGAARDHLPGGDQGGGCGHVRVEWTGQRPLPEGASCLDCGTWWRVDLIPEHVAERLNGGIPPRADKPRDTGGCTRS